MVVSPGTKWQKGSSTEHTSENSVWLLREDSGFAYTHLGLFRNYSCTSGESFQCRKKACLPCGTRHWPLTKGLPSPQHSLWEPTLQSHVTSHGLLLHPTPSSTLTEGAVLITGNQLQTLFTRIYLQLHSKTTAPKLSWRCWSSATNKERAGWVGTPSLCLLPHVREKLCSCCWAAARAISIKWTYRGQQTCAVKNLTSQNVSHDIWATKDSQPSPAGFLQQLAKLSATDAPCCLHTQAGSTKGQARSWT